MKLVCIFITTRMLQTTNTTTNKLSGLHWIDISSKWQARFALHTKLDRRDKKNYITNDISGNWGGGGARITDVVLQSGWACSAVVQSATPRTPSSFHPISDGYHSVVCSRVQDENVQRLWQLTRKTRRSSFSPSPPPPSLPDHARPITWYRLSIRHC